MNRFTRRRFLQASAATAVLPLFHVTAARAAEPETVRLAIAGINGRGREHIDALLEVPGVEITYLIDPDSRLFERVSRRLVEAGRPAPRCVQDVREALEDKNLDAIHITTCNHWHSLMTIWACQAGKHVYVEKPLSHDVFEGRQCVKAARRYNRIVQHGTQQRSDPKRARQIAAIRDGKYGKLLVAKGYCCKPRWSIGVKPETSPPAGYDYNLWLGPAPQQPFHENLHPYNWHWFWDFGNGDIGNQGVHEMDVARWAIPGATLPTKVWSLGGRYLPDGPDQGQTPNMLLSVYEFGDTLLVFETRGLVAQPGAPPFKVANEFFTTEGVIRDDVWMEGDKRIAEFRFYPRQGGPPERIEGDDAPVTPGGPFGAFVTAVRSDDTTKNNCDAEVGHYSAALCHLGNISYRLGQPTAFGDLPAHLGDNAQVRQAFAAICENLQTVNIPLADKTYQLGPVLEFDPATERFPHNDDANQLLTRSYRAPFVVPEQV